MKLLLKLFLLLGYIFFTAELALAFSIQLIDGKIQLDKDNITYEQSKLALETKAELWEITADKIIYNQATQKIFLEGSAEIKNEQLVISGKEIIFDGANELFIINNGTIIDQQNNLEIQAAKIEQQEKNLYELESAFFTSCIKPEKDTWRIFFSTVTYRVNNFAVGSNSIFYLQSIPILYAPVFSWPTVLERTSGVLPPTISYRNSPVDREFGLRIKLPYFFNINQQTGYTLSLDYLQTRGVALEHEFNYLADNEQTISARLWHLEETIQPRDGSGDDFFNPQRYFYDFFYKTKLSERATLLLEMFRQSDSEVQEDYFFNETLIENNIAKKEQVSFNYQWDKTYFLFKAEQNEIFLNENTPRLNKNLDPTATNWMKALLRRYFQNDFLETDFLLEWENFLTKQGWAGERASFNFGPKLTLGNSYFFFEPSIQNRFISYQVNYITDSNEIESDSNKKKFSLNQRKTALALGLNFENRLIDGKWDFQAKVSYENIVDIDQRLALETRDSLRTENIYLDYLDDASVNIKPIFDAKDQVLAKDAATLELLWRYRQVGSVQDVFLANLSLTYDFNAIDNTDDLLGLKGPFILPKNRENALSLESKWLPLHFFLSWSPKSKFKLNYFSRYDFNAGENLEQRANLETSFKKFTLALAAKQNLFDYIDLNNIKYFKKDELEFRSTNKLSNSWSSALSLKKNYLLPENKLPETAYFVSKDVDEINLNLIYEDCCAKIDLSFYEKVLLEQNDYKLDRGANLDFQIKSGF